MMMKTRFFSRRSAKDLHEPPTTTTNNNSERSAGSGMIIDSERTAVSAIQSDGDIDIDIDLDFSVTESGRTVAHLGVATGGGGAPLSPPPTNDLDVEDVDFSITSSGRTIEHIMQEQASAAANPNSQQQILPAAPAAKATTTTPLVPAATVTISNPLTILPPPSSSSASALTTSLNSTTAAAATTTTTTTGTMKSPSRPIPQNNRHGSEDSTGSAFLSGILNTTHSNTNNHHQQQLSHTPPTAFGTSYENKHFGKRQRSGSVSGRLRSASDLEEKGLIDRSQKGILKDLIICGDEELQQALDQYENGDPTVLEHMIQSGALQSKAVPDLDLLGDLDLDFLNMAGGGELGVPPPENKDGPGMYTLPQKPEQQQATATTRASSLPTLPQKQQQQPGKRHASETVVSGMVCPYHDDGIGELEFTGDFSENGDGGYYGTAEPPAAAAATAATDPTQQHHHLQFSNQQQQQQQQQQHSNNSNRQRLPSFSVDEYNKRLRSGSVFSIDSFADQRWRSNSLFSSLINDPKSSTSENHQELGRWMDRVPVNDHNTTATATATATATGVLVTTDDGPHHDPIAGTAGQQTTAVSKPIPIPSQPAEGGQDGAAAAAAAAATVTAKPTKKKKTPTRRKSDSAAILDRQRKAKIKQELAEQKRKEKQEKREKKEREKQEKKEARLAAKEEKKKLKDQKKQAQQAAAVAAKAMEVDEKPVHVPGSGRPRSMSDPNFKTKRDDFGLVEIERPEGWVGAYSPESRKVRIEKFLAKRHQRVWTKTVKYDVRKNFADSRLRVKGRFVKKEDEMLMRDLMSMT